MYIKKPWRIYTNCDGIVRALENCVCPGVDANHIQESCRGDNAKNSERYTVEFAKHIHRTIMTVMDRGWELGGGSA